MLPFLASVVTIPFRTPKGRGLPSYGHSCYEERPIPETNEVRRGAVLLNNGQVKEVFFSVRGDDAVFEGDILIGTVNHAERLVGVRPAIVAKNGRRWPNGIIPYRLDNSLTATIRARIGTAITVWHENTRIRLRERRSERDYVTFRRAEKGCSAQVGRSGGKQFVNLTDDCPADTVVHEIGHTVGLWHEQSREDRDKFVTINWRNIASDHRHNFNQHVTDGDDSGPYDYESIMHYHAFAFAEDPTIPTILAPAGVTLRGRTLSLRDIAAVEAFYPRWTRNVKIGTQKSKRAPGLAVFRDQLHMVHLGASENDLWWSEFNGRSWTTDVKIPRQKSKATPALATFRDRLHMLHLGDSSNDIWWSQFDGALWSTDVKIADQKSKAPPALAVLDDVLHMVHLDNSSNRVWWSWFDGNRWFDNLPLDRHATKFAPALAAFEGRLHMVYPDADSHDLLWSHSDGRVWQPPQRIEGQKAFGPVSLAASGGELHMVHRDSKVFSNRIWHSRFDGAWRPNVTVEGQLSQTPPVIASLRDTLYMVHTSDDAKDMWFSSLV